MTDKKLWFKAKRFGWGWYPCSWEGWLVLLTWVAGNVIHFKSIDVFSHSNSDTLLGYSPFFILSTAVLLIICYLTGEKPSWNWGKKKD
jgi:hypothetical protein